MLIRSQIARFHNLYPQWDQYCYITLIHY